MTIIFIRAIIIYVLVIVSLRIMGKRQVGELKPHELVITILISAIAAVPLEDNSMPLANSIIPILLFVSLEIIVSAISLKSYRLRDLIQGKPAFIIRKGKLNQSVLSQMRFTADDLIDALRQRGYFNLDEIEDAVIETNGSISVLPKAEHRPLTPKDISVSVKENGMPITVVMDGRSVERYFSNEVFSKSEINLILANEGVGENAVFLLTIDDGGNIFKIEKEELG